MKARCSSCQAVVSRVITEADNPAAEPKNPSRAGTKSPVESPCRYKSGRTSVTFGDLRHQGGTITERNWAFSPVSSSTRLSFTLGAVISTAPATVWTLRCRACPLRVTRRCPFSSRSSASSARYASTSASKAAASIALAPSRQISSRPERASAPASSLFTTLNIGVPSSPAR